MASLIPNKPPAVIVDASLVIGFCAKEASKYHAAKARLEKYSGEGWQLFAPGVMIGEVLYILCKKLRENVITSVEYDESMKVFGALIQDVNPPPQGDSSLVVRAEQIRANYGCARSNDSLYLALAEQLKQGGQTEIVTFDAKMKKHAAANAAAVNVEVLAVAAIS